MSPPEEVITTPKPLASVDVLPSVQFCLGMSDQEESSGLGDFDHLSAMVALGIPLSEIGDSLIRLVKERITSIGGALITRNSGESHRQELEAIALTDLPPSYQRSLCQSLEIPCDNIFWKSCTTGEPIIQSDITQSQQDWHHWDWAISSGLASCWVFPIFSLDENTNVIGLLVLFRECVGAPNCQDWQLIEEVIQLAGVGIERHRCEMHLRQLQQNYSQLLDTLPGILWEADGRTLMLNHIGESVEALLGYPMQRYLTSQLLWNEAVHPEDRQRVHRARLSLLEGKTAADNPFHSESLRYRLVSSTGQAIWVQEHLTSYRDHSQKPILRGHITVFETVFEDAVPLSEMSETPIIVVPLKQSSLVKRVKRQESHNRHSRFNSQLSLSRSKAEQQAFSKQLESKGYYELFQDEALELREAIRRQELQVYYHGILSLESDKLIGFEALLRWDHPRLGLLTPNQFWGIAERSGLAVEIGWWVLTTACQKVLEWQDIFMPGVPLSLCVNVSPLQLEQEDFISRLTSILEAVHFPAVQLMLEITEDAMMSFSRKTQSKLSSLRAKKISFNIDNFGFGFCSLHQLNQLPISALKIDPFFVKDLKRQGAEELIRAIVSLALDLNLQVIAEGVETSEQSALLRDMGCKYAQGYLFHQPLPSELVQHLFVQPSPPSPRKRRRRSCKTA
ncbi:MAG: EAL domain-containing protein [Thermostichus sp. DG02_5_bins_236]